MTVARLGLKVKVVRQRSMSSAKKKHHCYIALGSRTGSRSKVRVKVIGHRSNFWCAMVDIRGSTLPDAAKSNNHHYQSKVITCAMGVCR